MRFSEEHNPAPKLSDVLFPSPETVTNLPKRAAERMVQIQPPNHLTRARNLRIARDLGMIAIVFVAIGFMLATCGRGHTERTDRAYSEVQAGEM